MIDRKRHVAAAEVTGKNYHRICFFMDMAGHYSPAAAPVTGMNFDVMP
jgi:hypothetical protein